MRSAAFYTVTFHCLLLFTSIRSLGIRSRCRSKTWRFAFLSVQTSHWLATFQIFLYVTHWLAVCGIFLIQNIEIPARLWMLSMLLLQFTKIFNLIYWQHLDERKSSSMTRKFVWTFFPTTLKKITTSHLTLIRFVSLQRCLHLIPDHSHKYIPNKHL